MANAIQVLCRECEHIGPPEVREGSEWLPGMNDRGGSRERTSWEVCAECGSEDVERVRA